MGGLRILAAVRLCGLMASMPGVASGLADEPAAQLARKAEQAMQSTTSYFRTHVALHGGYVYFYSPDLERRFGEGEARGQVIWVQPPGTPTVGEALLDAWDASQDPRYLEGAQEAGQALIYGQLQSGGWTNCIDFDPQGTRVALYRNGRGQGRNYSSLDDDQTQAALRFLMRLDQASGFRNAEVHAAVRFGLDALLAAQYPIGAFPQVWQGPVDATPRAIIAADFPDYDWRSENRIKEYWNLYTLNDDVAVHVFDTLARAHAIYHEPRFLQAIRRLGDFLILAQLPAPQRGWAQQYNFEMHPAWARRFEPPAVSGHESQQIVRLLMEIHRLTGDDKYLQPIPAALSYLRSCQLPDGKLARYYELETNRPLYMQRRDDVYELTYSDEDLPPHYGWNAESLVTQLEQQYEHLRAGQAIDERLLTDDQLMARVAQILREQDAQGRWLSVGDGSRLVGQNRFASGERYLSTATFCDNIGLLAELVRRHRVAIGP